MRFLRLFLYFFKHLIDIINTLDKHSPYVRLDRTGNLQISPIGEWVKKNPPQSNLGEEGTAVVLF